jgi:3-deoxy-D-arabino-heptulosonate 7-phosphate (DAHP) synthase
VETMSRAALATGAHGLLVEAHNDVLTRDELRCDAQQGVPPEVLRSIIEHASRQTVPVITDSAA